jgi:hypothetical protein
MGQTYIDFFRGDGRDPPQAGRDPVPPKSLPSGSSFGPLLLKIISYKLIDTFETVQKWDKLI